MRKIFIADSACTDEALMEVADQNPLAALLWPWLLVCPHCKGCSWMWGERRLI